MMIFHHIAKRMSKIIVQDIQYFGVNSNIRVENPLAGLAAGQRMCSFPGSKRPREGTRCIPSRGLVRNGMLRTPHS